ncbi:MAG: Leucyl/phenylalanyl-tRNA--protein transferase, partial [uncultured Frankineae bacterium]
AARGPVRLARRRAGSAQSRRAGRHAGRLDARLRLPGRVLPLAVVRRGRAGPRALDAAAGAPGAAPRAPRPRRPRAVVLPRPARGAARRAGRRTAVVARPAEVLRLDHDGGRGVRAGRRRLRGARQHLDHAAHASGVRAAALRTAVPDGRSTQRRGVGRGCARRRPVRRAGRAGLLRRVHVPPGDRRLEGRARRAVRAPARRRRQPRRRAGGDAAPRIAGLGARPPRRLPGRAGLRAGRAVRAGERPAAGQPARGRLGEPGAL